MTGSKTAPAVFGTAPLILGGAFFMHTIAKRLFMGGILWGGLCLLGGMPLEAAPRRIVSLLPSHTDTLSVLGLLGRVVGVGDAEDPRLLPRLPRVGGTDISWETLAALQPDLVLADVSHRRFDPLFQRLRLPVAYLPATRAATVDDLFGLVEEIGRLTESGAAAAEWIAKARKRVQDLDARRLPAPGPRVYFEVWPHPLQAFGPGGLTGHLLKRAGARNVVTAREPAPLISAEAVVRADPEIIFHTGIVTSQDLAARPGWESVSAVKTMRVVEMNADHISQAGPRALEGWAMLLDFLEGARR
jgi:iron complex transport system substrate-binding protein